MKKNRTGTWIPFKNRRAKIFLIMRLTLFMVLGLVFSLSASVRAQDQLVTLKVEKMSFIKVISELKQQTRLDFFYSFNEVDVNQTISLSVKNAKIDDVLRQMLGDKCTWEYIDNMLIIKPRRESAPEKKTVCLKGFVRDTKKQPLPGVTVKVVGLHVGTATNEKGWFTLNLPLLKGALEFSFVGFKKKQVNFTVNTDTLRIVLEEDISEVDEVVITGYQRINKRESTSSIFTLNSEEIMEANHNTLDNMLQGKIPGMAVMNMSSTVGAAPKIRIRGSSSILGNREPLWVLDGVVLTDPIPLDVTELNSSDKVNLIGNAISGLNPEDIDRIDVLKDASATALYGIKAANGVIVITTKRGKIGDPAFRYSGSINFLQRPTQKDMHLMNSRERIEVSEEMHSRGLEFKEMDPRGAVGYEAELTKLWGSKVTVDEFNRNVEKLKEMNTDWYDLLFRNTVSTSHTFSFSGANEKLNYYFSVGYSDMQGATLQEKGERFNFSTNLNMVLSERFRVGFGLSANMGTTNRPGPGVDLYAYAFNTSRAISPFNEDGSYRFYDMNVAKLGPNLDYNIFNELDATGQKNSNQGLSSRLNIDYNILKGLSFSALFSYSVNASTLKNHVAENSYAASLERKTRFGYELPDPKKDESGFANSDCNLPFGGIYTRNTTNGSALQGRASLSYNGVFGNHSLSVSVGGELGSTAYDGFNTKSYGYLPDRGEKYVQIDPTVWRAYGRMLMQNPPLVLNSKSNVMSYYATFAYTYAGRYTISTNVRGDASNKLGQDKDARFLPIWSLSGRWNVADEAFMKNCNWMTDLSLRGSFGLQGNVTDAHNPNMIALLGSLDVISHQYFSTLSSLPNRGLLWEKTASFNLGLDFTLFDAVSVSTEFYTKKGRDQLTSMNIDPTNGASSVTINNGDISNKGWELSLSGTPIKTKNLSLGISFNTGKNYNKVKNTPNTVLTYTDYINGNIVREGRPVNSFYSYRFGGLDQRGLPIFLGVQAKDADENTLISSREDALEQAFEYSGKREPDLTGGFSLNLRVKNISVNAGFSFAVGSKIRLNNLYESDNQRLPYPRQNMQDEFVNRWKKPGDEKFTDIPRLDDSYPAPTGAFSDGMGFTVGQNIWQMYNYSNHRVFSGNFLRCRSIGVSYGVPAKTLKEFFVKAASLSLGMSNPFVIKDKGLKGRDPEQMTLGSGSIPPRPSYTCSLSLTF